MPLAMAIELEQEAKRQNGNLSALLQDAWRLAKATIKQYPSRYQFGEAEE